MKPSRGLLLCVLLSIACVAYPIYVIRPFRAQGATELAAALAVLRFRTPLVILTALASAVCAWLYWREHSGRTRRILAVAGSGLVFAMAVLTRVNVYERMFHPIAHPSFSAASAVNLDKDEKVIAVKMGSVARAYPIRGLAYHHIANDVVDKTAIVATY
jgi:uncharacterized membrane protein